MIKSHALREVVKGVCCKTRIIDYKSPIVVTFANAGKVIHSTRLRENVDPWGYRFLSKRGINVISFACVDSNNWYFTVIPQDGLESYVKHG